MGIRLRFLTANITVLAAVAGMLNPLSPEWESAHKNRGFCVQRTNTLEYEDEQTTSEEEQVKVASGSVEVAETPAEQTTALAPDTAPEAPVEAIIQASPLYLVEGEQLDPGVADYLYRRLSEAGIGWFYEYALCLAYQESSFNPLAENPNGRDKGLFQFRVEFHPTLVWQNPYAQTDLFVAMMANRAAAGCDVYSMISRHNTSDYCPEINPVYVAQVLSHFPTLQRIR